MAVWSSLGRALQGAKILNNVVNKHLRPVGEPLVRTMSGGHGPRKMEFQPSRWQWTKFKDLTHFYICVGVIPLALLTTYVNIFIGPAQLAPIPEGYEPMEWEYHEHPITRFFVKYMHNSEQQEYEKYCHLLWEEYDKMEFKQLLRKVKMLQRNRNDYQGWYFAPYPADRHRKFQREMDEHIVYDRTFQKDN